MPAVLQSWCGVDIGTTNVKVLVVAANGRVLSRASCPTPRVSDAYGPCTDADQLLDLIESLVLQAVDEAGIKTPLAAICTGGVGEDGVLLDADLRPLDLSIPWNDQRAAAQADRLATSPLWKQAKLPVAVELTRTAAKWAWLRDNRASLVDDAGLWIALTDYAAVRWSGAPFMSRTLATRTACYDPVAREWRPELLQDCGAPPLPLVVSGGSVVGQARSDRLLAAGAISSSTVVVAGGHDHPMGASLVCGSVPGAILDSMGTAELVYVESATSGPADPFFNASATILEGNTAWLGVLELSRMLEPMQQDGHPLRELFRIVMEGCPMPGSPGAQGLRYLPQTEIAHFAPDASASERLRAVLEGGAMLSRMMIRRADALAGAPEPGPVFVAGGWARSDTLLQLRADVIGRTLRRLTEPQLSALGSAHLAARGTGTVLPVALATQDFVPDPERRRFYDGMFEADYG